MAVRPVVELPARVLQQPTRAVAAVDDAVRTLIDDLVDTMRVSPGCVGLAANQIGDDRRVFVVDVTGHKKARAQHGLIALVNPTLLAAEAPELAREGCMSVPDLTGDVPRATRVVVAGLDREGRQLTIASDAFEARALLHELDHLDGYVFLDRVASHAAVFRRKVYR
ncbi:MAG TPA: peptide deformylase [Acidimicrobiales bacterium]|jgi:peptide deformylase|nr:peptide deformylase [Acidimicrobiales bacterium]